MTGKIFLDTDILLYSISTAVDERAKRDVAVALLERDDCVLSIQVLQEFYVQSTRRTRMDPLPHDLAEGFIKAWTRFTIQENTVSVLRDALAITKRTGYSFWDSSVIAAARAAGCRELYSEDLSHGQEVDGVRIFDPFR